MVDSVSIYVVPPGGDLTLYAGDLDTVANSYSFAVDRNNNFYWHYKISGLDSWRDSVIAKLDASLIFTAVWLEPGHGIAWRSLDSSLDGRYLYGFDPQGYEYDDLSGFYSGLDTLKQVKIDPDTSAVTDGDAYHQPYASDINPVGYYEGMAGVSDGTFYLTNGVNFVQVLASVPTLLSNADWLGVGGTLEKAGNFLYFFTLESWSPGSQWIGRVSLLSTPSELPPLKLKQRDDNIAIGAGARLEMKSGNKTSAQHRTAPRVTGKNTYDFPIAPPPTS